MNIYTLRATSCFEEETQNLGVFSSEEKAREYFKKWNEDPDNYHKVEDTVYSCSIFLEKLDPTYDEF